MPTAGTPSPEAFRAATAESNRPSPPVDESADEPRSEPGEQATNLTCAELSNNDENEDVNIVPNPIGNLDGCVPTAMGIRLSEVLDGKRARDDDGAHFDGEAPDDAIWWERYESIVAYLLIQCDAPISPI